MILETIIGALVPVGIDGIKSLIGMFTGGVKPLNVDDQIKLDQNEIAKLEVIAKLDNPYGQPSQWVIDLRASSRYLGALFVIVVGISTLFLPVAPEIQRIGIEAANIAFGFLFGTRIMANLKK
tara:strand:- start:537 stop:905 length:369 start_codon:yes stop_codon:yes gene_type:complete